MIVTEFYNGQGLGNQLWCYVTTRLIAQNKGYDFGIKSPEKFKGIDFIDIDFGKQVIGGTGPEGGPAITLPAGIEHYYVERSIIHKPSGSDVRIQDPSLINISDNTKIDGYMQDMEYISKHKNVVAEWLKVKPEYEFFDFSKDNICIINFRGGTYAYDKDFFLPGSYWKNAVDNMLKIRSDMRFIVITDDVETGKKFFTKYDVFHFSIAKDYVIIKNAKYLILSNSSFAMFPAWFNQDLKYCIAPKYWARHNVSDGYWSLGYNIVKGWMYQNKEGKLSDYETCTKEFKEYLERNQNDLIYTDTNKNYTPYKQISFIEKIKGITTIPLMALNTERQSKSFFGAFIIVLARYMKKVPRIIYSKVKSPIKKIILSIINTTKKHLSEEKIQIFRYIVAIKNRLKRKITLASVIEYIKQTTKEKKAKKTWLPTEDIVKYRKKIKIYDIFSFFNELDLLEIRLEILGPYVDYFVLAESTKTFSGDNKPLYYNENKDRFKKWNHKIIHLITEDAPKDEDELRSRLHKKTSYLDHMGVSIIVSSLTSDTVSKESSNWMREFYIKESVKKALEGLNDEDICYVSDLDEIWDPKLIIDYSKDDVFKLIQKPYIYFLNNRSDEHWSGWTGTIVTKYKNIRNSCLNHLRANWKMKDRYVYLTKGGWHFSFQGGYEGAKRKIVESNHFWYKADKMLPTLEKKINSKYIYDHKGQIIKTWIDESGLPEYLITNKHKYAKFFR